MGSGLLLGPSFSAVFLSSEQITAAAAKTNSPILHNGKPNPQPLTAHLFWGLAGAEKKKPSPLPSRWVPAELWRFPASGQGLAPAHLLFPGSHSLYGQAHTSPGPGWVFCSLLRLCELQEFPFGGYFLQNMVGSTGWGWLGAADLLCSHIWPEPAAQAQLQARRKLICRLSKINPKRLLIIFVRIPGVYYKLLGAGAAGTDGGSEPYLTTNSTVSSARVSQCCWGRAVQHPALKCLHPLRSCSF